MPRKKEFEPDVALDKAMRYFWAHGYNDTSIRDLISGTGVNFYGLYNVFGDKRGIYVNSLEHYCETFLKQIRDAALEGLNCREKIKSIFDKIAKITIAENDGAGCLVCNASVEVAPHDEGVFKIVRTHRKNLETMFHEILGESETAIENRSDVAEFLATQVYMIGLLARSKASKKQIERHINVITSLLC